MKQDLSQEYYANSLIEYGVGVKNWGFKRIKYAVMLVNEKVTAGNSDLPFLGLEHIESWTGKLTSNLDGSTSDGQTNHFKEEDVLFGKLRPYLAKVFKANFEGTCTGELLVLRPTKVINDYLFYYLLSRDFISIVDSSTYGAKMPRANWEFIGNLPIIIPPESTQRSIVKFLDNQTSRIDKLINKKEDQIELLKEKRFALIHDAVKDPSTRNMRIEHVADRIFRPISRKDDEVYTPVGLYNRGRGIFHKEPTNGSDLGDSDFFWIQTDDLILSGQFAWEGAVALASEEEAGCVASHRYPILRGKPNLIETAYLYAFFTTKTGDFLLNEHSRGAAGRNRPLNAGTLLKESIPVPPIEAQGRVSAHVYFERRIERTIEKSIELLKKYRNALITAAVTGKVDVRKEAA